MTQSNVLTFRNTKTEVAHEGKRPENIFFRIPRYDPGLIDIILVISPASFLMYGVLAESPIRIQLQK